MSLDKILELPADSPNLLFRFEPFGKSQRDQFVREVLGLANADVEGDRFLVFGVHFDGTAKKIVGLTDGDIRALGQDSKQILKYIEPELTITRIKSEIDGVEVAAIQLKQCENQPYLIKEDISESLKKGECWIREGSDLRRAGREDLDRLYGRKPVREVVATPAKAAAAKSDETASKPCRKTAAAPVETANVKVGFNGKFDSELLEVSIPASTGKSNGKPVQAVELKLAVVNMAPSELEGAVLDVNLPRDAEFDVGQKKSADAKAKRQTRIDKREDGIRIRARLGTLEPDKKTTAFHAPVMLGIGAAMRGKKIGLKYAIVARNLAEPIKGRLKIKFTG